MTPLCSVALSLAPELARVLVADESKVLETRIAQTVQEETGTSDVAVAQHLLSEDIAVCGRVRLRLARICVDSESAGGMASASADPSFRRNAADTRNEAYGRPGRMPWAPVIVSVAVLMTFGLMMWAALTRSLPSGSETILNVMLGTLAAMATSVVTYWVGSSAGSATKTEMLFSTKPPS